MAPCCPGRVRFRHNAVLVKLAEGCVLSSPSGVQFEVKRVELQGTAPLFCCWLVKDLLHGQQASATRTRLLLASLPSSTHSACEHPGPSLGEVGVWGLLCLAVAFLCGPVFLAASLSLSLSSGTGGGF